VRLSIQASALIALIALVVVVTFISVPIANAAPSFNCAKAANAIEKLVCNDAELAALDVELASLYRARLRALDTYGQAALRRDQKTWIDHRTRFCLPPLVKDDQNRRQCVLRNYQERVAELRGECEVDDEHTLDERASSKEPSSNKVPAGFSVQQNVQVYVVVHHTTAYVLPSREPSANKSFLVSGIGAPSWQLMSCTATAPDGSQWLVINEGQILFYVWPGDTEPASSYDAKVVRENKEREERRKQQSP
jgi:uncharacterized protein